MLCHEETEAADDAAADLERALWEDLVTEEDVDNGLLAAESCL